MYWLFDSTYIIILPAILLSIYAQSKIQSTYSKFKQVRSMKGINGFETASRLLSLNGLQNIRIEMVSGNLTDHYDPRNKVLRLSNGVYYGNNIAAIGVAAHEVGHAIQHAEGYIPIKIRNFIVPIASFGSKFSWILLLIGLFLGNKTFVDFGIYLFCAIVLFQLITLPVELNASNRAIYQLSENGLIYDNEKSSVKKVLNAAALTYVAAVFMSIMQLVRLLALTGRFRDRD